MLDFVEVCPVPKPQLAVKGGLVNRAAVQWAKDENAFFNECVAGLPSGFRSKVMGEYHETRRSSLFDATVFVREVAEASKKITFTLATNDTELREKADYYAARCEEIYKLEMNRSGALDDAFLLLAKFAIDVPKITAPEWDKKGFFGACARLQCAKWWRGQLRKKHARGLESLALNLNQVNDFRGIYVSDETAKRRFYQKQRNAQILQGVTATNQNGQEYTLFELSELSISNPKLRRMELMTRIRGFEEFAGLMGHVGEFYTITCPSKMHSTHQSSKWSKARRNQKYDHTTPKEAQKYLTDQWEKVRSALDKKGVKLYGFRVVEPNHDGTPHWHTLFFMKPEHRFYVRYIIAKYALEMDGEEKGALKYRFKFESIKTGTNPRTGKEYSAAGYIAKYISKAIDGYGIDQDLFGNDAQTSAQRIEAWASTWGIRQFQQVGGAGVTVWRELRRLGDEEVSGNQHLEMARDCANNGDWCGYCLLNWHKEIKLMKNEISTQCEVNKYGDQKLLPIVGVECGGVGVITRKHTWQIGEAGLAQLAKPASTWTGVNNCTEEMLNSALNHFNQYYKAQHHSKVAWAVDQGFEVDNAFYQVKGQEMARIIKSWYGIEGGVSISTDFKEKITAIWQEANPREMLYEEFEEVNIFGDGDYQEFVENHLSEFIREFIGANYCLKMGSAYE